MVKTTFELISTIPNQDMFGKIALKWKELKELPYVFVFFNAAMLFVFIWIKFCTLHLAIHQFFINISLLCDKSADLLPSDMQVLATPLHV